MAKKSALILSLLVFCGLGAWGVFRMVGQARFVRADEFWRGDPEAIGWMIVAAFPICPALIGLLVLAIVVARFKGT